jgi:branched-chain amino acid transport system substrate-binding protein
MFGTRWTLRAFAALSLVALAAGTASAQGKDPIIIGAAIAQSGFAAPYDSDPAKAAQLAIEDINAKGGVLGRPLKLEIRDTKSDVAQGAVVAQELIDLGAKVIVVTGDFDFGGAAARAANARNVIAIAPFAADPKFGVRGIGPYAFTFATAADTVGTVLAEFAAARGWKTAYVLTQNTIQYDQTVSAFFQSRFKELNGAASIVGTDVFAMDDASIAAQITRIKALPNAPDVIMLSTFTPAGPSALRQIRAAGLNMPVVSGEDMDGDYWTASVPNLGNFYFATMGSIFGDDPDEAVRNFIARFKQKHGNHPATAHTLTGYAMIQALAVAMERAKSVEPAAVKAELEKFKDEKLLVGPTSYTPQIHINFNRPLAIVGVEGGKHKFVERRPPQKPPTPRDR